MSSVKYSLVYYLEIGDQSGEIPGILNLDEPKEEILATNGMIVIFDADKLQSVSYKGKKIELWSASIFMASKKFKFYFCSRK